MSSGKNRLDFWVKKEVDEQNLSIKILDYTFLERIRCNKPTILVITGDSGEAKSSISQALSEKLLNYHGIDYKPFVNDVTVYTPFEFPEKEQALLEQKRLKKIPLMIIDEARLVVKAKNWHNFINQAIADVLALQRRVKRIFLIVVTQDLDDIDKDIRRQITFWGEAYRPLHGQAELRISKFYKDTRKPSKIELKKRKLRGIIQDYKGRTKLDFPKKFVFKMPSREIWEIYDKQNYLSKGAVIKRKLEEMIANMKKEQGIKEKTRGETLLGYYMKPEKYQELMFHFRTTRRGKYRLKKGAEEVLGLHKTEIKDFEELVHKGMKKLQGEIKNGV